MKPKYQNDLRAAGAGARAPGKIILGGEHAVVAGRPALLAAVGLYLEARVRPLSGGRLRCEAEGLGRAEEMPSAELPALRERLDERHRVYRSGGGPVESLLDNPLRLVQYAAALAWERGGLCAGDGLAITIRSQLPVGSGLGSSAAAVLSVLLAVSQRAGQPFTKEELLEAALSAERLQHGCPSGADPYAILHGGLVRYARGQAPLRVSAALPRACLVFTGKPVCGTGACVDAVRGRFPENDPIWDDFEETVGAMERALAGGPEEAWPSAVRRHHRLLQRIGVVPETAACFIDKVERAGGAAKVCGAGAVRGERAGVLLAVGNPDRLRPLCLEQDYDMVELEMDHEGTQSL